jgi:DNA-directed RNA polymerase
MDQMILEQQMLQSGFDRYTKAQAKATKRKELTSAQDRLFKEAVGSVMEAMDAAVAEVSGPGAKPSWHLPVTTLGSLKAAVLTLRDTFNLAANCASYVNVTRNVGRAVEVEMIAKAVEEKDTVAYKKITKKVKRLSGKAFKTKVISEMAQEQGFWDPLGHEEHVKMGAGLLNFVLEATDLFVTSMENEGTSDQTMVVGYSPEAIERLKLIEDREAWMRPLYGPMVEPPKDWESAFTGCYQDPRLSNTFKVIKTGNRDHLTKVDAAIRAGAPFVKALNAIQAVPLRINPFVLEWVEKAWENAYDIDSFPSRKPVVVPEDAPRWVRQELRRTENETRSGQANFLNDLDEAKTYASYGTFYLPGQLDWRGRVYCKPHLNHQREDHCKALFEFANGKSLDAMGAVWLAIQVATTAGFKVEGKALDKLPLMDRYQWTSENTERLCAMVKDPAADLWWTTADAPFCFLAAAKAWSDYQDQGDAYVCHLPVNVDGSCSGLQHFSAMLRDPIGAKHVNLEPSEIPSDVYQAVADAVLPIVEADVATGNVIAMRWMSIGINRKIAKRCVMTYVYGSKQFGFSEHLADDFAKELEAAVRADLQAEPEEDEFQFKARVNREVKGCATYLAAHIWKSVQATVKAAAEGMGWLQDVAGLLAGEGKAATWTTPMGFPVINAYFEPQVERVDLILYDRTLQVPQRFVPRVKTGDTDELMKRKCRSSISPNFVHSMDSSHLQAAVLKSAEEGITDFLLIHDSFGCLPTDMSRYVQIVRETFVEQYLQNDPLQDLHDRALGALSEEGKADLTPPPAKGEFDLNQVLESHYAFA